MTITAATIRNNYQEVGRKDAGAEFVRVDLHVHTPASGDAQVKNKYNFKFNIANIPASLQASEQLAEQIVAGALAKGLRLIAVTDHNTPSNTHPHNLTDTWYRLLRDAAAGKELTVLPGVEISTDDLHILVILDPKDEPPTYITHRINFLLQDCKFTLKEYGDYRATGMSSLFDVLEYIEALGTTCIAIPAHIDGGKKAMLEVYKEPSNVFRKLLNHPNLNTVEVVKDTTPTRKKIGKKYVGEYFESLRDENRSPIGFIQDSDGHAIAEIGKRFTYIRMGQPDFWSLRNALENPETRLRLPKYYCPDTDKTRILGIAYSTGGKWDAIALNANLNCVIGKKQTNKSTVIDLILYGLKRFEEDAGQAEDEWMQKHYSVNVFLARGPEVYCYSREKGSDKPSIYQYKNDAFTALAAAPDIELPRRYNHERIMKMFSRSTGLMDFLDWRIFNTDQMKSLLTDRTKYLGKVKAGGFQDGADMTKLVEACNKLYDERKKAMEPTLQEYGEKLFKVKVTKGKYRGNKEEDYYDRAAVTVRVNGKYKTLSRLATGEKNAAVMVLLMNQGVFGPLIIDEPEQYLDVKSITGMLVPRMRQLKTRQQIICATRDEHILVSGDAEQVIATQSESKLEAVTGDINNRLIQEQILEIFEGDRDALLEKTRKLRRILE